MILIAETAWHHDGDYDFFLALISKICSHTKTDYIKVHISLDVDEYMHHDHPAYKAVIEKSFSINQWEKAIDIILAFKKKPMFLVNDKKALDFCLKYNPELVEIHSVCLNDINLLEYLKNKLPDSTKIVLGVGGSSLYEIENSLNILNRSKIILMHGFQNYPTRYEDINFNKVQKIIKLFPEYEHGYADHTAWNNEHNLCITTMAIPLGVTYLEKHVTTLYGCERLDWQAAISIEMFNELYEQALMFNACLGNGNLELNEGERKYSIFGINKKAVILNRDCKKGEIFTRECFNFKRTAQITMLSQTEALLLLGKTFKKDFKEGYCLNIGDVI